MYLVISLLVLRAGCGISLYQFLVIACLFTDQIRQRYFGDIPVPITVNMLLQGATDQKRTFNDLILKQVQLYIIAFKPYL